MVVVRGFLATAGGRSVLSTRVLQPELMDDPGLDVWSHTHALRGLARINRLSLAGRVHWPALCRVASRLDRPVRVTDAASGSGDGAVALARLARKRGIGVELTLTDLSPRAVGLAGTRAERAGIRARTRVVDATAGPLPEGDLLICSLFAHHLTESQAVGLLANMRRACVGGLVSVNDLRRCRWGTVLARTVPRMVTRSPVVHTDAAISAGAAFTERELLDLCGQAGLEGAVVRRCFPARMTMTWSTP